MEKSNERNQRKVRKENYFELPIECIVSRPEETLQPPVFILTSGYEAPDSIPLPPRPRFIEYKGY
jgi:hypothetical protein